MCINIFSKYLVQMPTKGLIAEGYLIPANGGFYGEDI